MTGYADRPEAADIFVNDRHFWRFAVVALSALLAGDFAVAESFVERFTGPNPSWKVESREPAARTVTHRRTAEAGQDGVGELIAVEIDREEATVRLEHSLPKARVLNELEATVWVRSLRPGVQIHLRVVLPDEKDAATGKTLAFRISGDVSDSAGEWQKLVCRTDDNLVQKQLVLLRAKQKRPLIPKTMYVDRVMLTWPLAAGLNEISLDELSFGPIVKPEGSDLIPTAGEADGENTGDVPVQFRQGRLEIQSKPCFPRMVAYHGEPLKELAAAGFNIVWVPDYSDRALLTSIREHGMWAVATPPAATVDGEESALRDAGLLPFKSDTRAIAFWMLGTRIPPGTQTQLVNWIDQVQEADREYRRPLAADVSGDEGLFSRELDMLGMSRHLMGGSLGFEDYRDWLQQRRESARPGTFCWTWIQTAPNPAVAAVWEQHQIPVQLEPEQIRSQAFAAIAAGMRGIGFWSNQPLSEKTPADRETLLAIRQLNWELRLLEPWLATTNSVSQIPVFFDAERKKEKARLDSRLQFKRKRNQPEEELIAVEEFVEQASSEMPRIPEGELTAAVLRTTDLGTLLLPMWLERHAQFVPGRMAADKLTMIVPGVSETAIAWEITTTGIRSLDTDRASGGMKLTLSNFDQTACILLTPDRNLIEQTRQRINEIAEQSAKTWLALAELKLERVRKVDQELGDAGLRQPEVPQLLGTARNSFNEARAAVGAGGWPRVRSGSQQALQIARVVQRVHWNEAVRRLPSPVASPFTIGYGSLPTQARLALQLSNDAAESSGNLLPTGQFEDAAALTAVGWQHAQDAPETIRADAELNGSAHSGKYSLRLIAAPATIGPRPTEIPGGREFVRITTPAVTVHAGHAIRISGWIRVPADLATSPDGAMIYDSLMGRPSGLRIRKACEDWQRFEIVREAVASQEMTVTIALTSVGEIFVDDLEITTHPLPLARQTSGEELARPQPAAPQSRWTDLRRWNPLSRRKSP
jgi:hypothetical protein